MAFEAKDGKKFSMSSRMRAHNQGMSAKEPQEKAPSAVLYAPGGEEEMGGEESPEQVHEQHGPPVEVNSQHDDGMTTHHVHSVHADGHEHHSEHGSREEAHEHIGKLHGIGKQEESAPEEGTGDEEEGY